MKRIVKPTLKILLPFIVIAAAVYGGVAMYKAKPEVKKHEPAALPPLIRYLEVEIGSIVTKRAGRSCMQILHIRSIRYVVK